jgi:chromosome segregation ATPase
MKELLKKLVEKLTSSKLTDEEKADLQAQIAEIEKSIAALQTPKKEPQKADDDAMKELREMLAAQTETVKQLTDALAKETKAREDGQKALKEQQKRDLEKKVDDFMKAHGARIAPSEKEEIKGKLLADFEGYSKLVAKLPEDPAMKSQKPEDRDRKTGDTPPNFNDYFTNKGKYIEEAKHVLSTNKN